MKVINSEKLQDRPTLYVIFVLITGAFSFAATLHLGKIVWDASIVLQEQIPKIGENIETYQQFIMSILQIGLSGFLIFATPIFFCTLLSLIPKPKMLISPYYAQTLVFALLVVYFTLFPIPDPQLFVIIMMVMAVGLMFASLVQHTIVEKLVGAKLHSIIKYSLRTRNASIKQVSECLMIPEVRNELGLTEITIPIFNGMRISGKQYSRRAVFELRNGKNEHETLINIVFYTISKNSVSSRNIENYAWKQLQFVKKSLFESHISFQEESAEKNTSFLIDFLEKEHEGMHKDLRESIMESKLKIALFAIGACIIGYLFWIQEFESAIFAVLTVLLYIVFEVTLYARKIKPSESSIF